MAAVGDGKECASPQIQNPPHGQPPTYEPGVYPLPGQVGPPQLLQPQAGYSGQPQTLQVVIQQPVQMHTPVELERQPVSTVCPHCRETIVTELSYSSGTATYVHCCLLCFICCCCLPFCSDCTKDVDHSCPNCDYLLGTYETPVTGDIAMACGNDWSCLQCCNACNDEFDDGD